MSYGVVSSPGLLSQQYPPPLLPKPGKDNVRLRKLLKKTAKKKAAQQAQQAAVPFRSSLSPVNEASPDLERSDHSTPPTTPETPMHLGTTLHPRFNVRPLYQHVASPYPHHRSFTYGMTARFSPQPYGAPSQTLSRPVTPLVTYTPPPRLSGVSPLPGPATYAEAHMLYGATPTPPTTPVTIAPIIAPPPEITTVSTTKPASEAPLTPAPMISTASLAPAKTVEPSKQPTTTAVVTQNVPSPKFHVFDATRSSRTMFEVPQITIYTAKTAYYETTTAPLHDTSGDRLSYYGRSPSPRPRSRTPTPDTRRGTSPMRLLTPASDSRRVVTPTAEIWGRTTPISEVKRGTTPTSEMRGRVTPNSEIRGRAVPVSEVKTVTTPTSEMRGRATPTSDLKKGTTPTSELKRGSTPTTEIKRVTTPTHEFIASKTSSGRPKTPSHHVIRAKTPVYEISRPNPLLFAVSPEYMEGRRSKTPTSLSVSGEINQKSFETEQPRVSIPNGDVQMKPLETSTTKLPTEVLSQPESQASVPKMSVKEASGPLPPIATPQMATSVSTAGTHRPKTPTQEASKPDTKTGYLAPAKTLTPPAGSPKPKSAQSQAQALKPIIGQRPKTPTHIGAKSTPKTYYGLTPAAYVAHGGIQTIAPSFSVSRHVTPTAETPKPEEKKGPEKPTTSQEEPKVEIPSEHKAKTTVAEVSTQKPASTENKASVSAKLQEATKPPVLQDKTKPVPVVERAKPQVTEVKRAKSPASSTVPKVAATETQKGKAAMPALPKPKTPISEIKTPPAQKQIAALYSKAKTSEKDSDEAMSALPKPKTPTSETKTPPAQKQIAALYSKAKTSEKDSDEAMSALPKPKTPTSEPKTSPAQKQIAALYSKAKTSEKDSDETKKHDTESKTVKEQSKVSEQSSKPKDSASDVKEMQLISSILSSQQKMSEPPKTDTNGAQSVAKSREKPADVEKPIKEEKAETKAGKPVTEEKKEKEESTFPEAEPLLKVVQKPKGMKSKLSGWSRLKKHMVVEVEEPKFPEPTPDSTKEPKKDIPNGDVPKLATKTKEEKEESSQQTDSKDAPQATKMWDAVLFQMFSSKEKIMQQIKANKSEEENEIEEKMADTSMEIPAFAHRLPVLLFSPKFDAKKLREAASRPVTKMSTVFEMGLIGRKTKDDEPKQFNRTAKGFSSSKPTED